MELNHRPLRYQRSALTPELCPHRPETRPGNYLTLRLRHLASSFSKTLEAMNHFTSAFIISYLLNGSQAPQRGVEPRLLVLETNVLP